jgi:alpha-L-fucosidase
MDRNGGSIYGCGVAEMPKPEWGRFTLWGNTLYAHIYEPQTGGVCLPDPAVEITLKE